MLQNEQDPEDIEKEQVYQIEQLSQQLEQIYKQIDFLEKENFLFENYIQRNNFKKVDINKDEVQILSEEVKYQIAQQELEEQNKLVQNAKIDSQQDQQQLESQLQAQSVVIQMYNKEINVLKEITNDQNEQKFDINIYQAYLQNSIYQKEKNIKQIKEKNAQLEFLRKNKNQQKKQNEDFEFKQIDFHQLQIENKRLNETYLDKTKNVQKLKQKLQNIKSQFDNSKLELKNQDIQIQELVKEQIQNEQQKNQLEKQQIILQQQINQCQKENDQLLLQKNKMEDNKTVKMKVSNFIKSKQEEKQLKYNIKNIIRKNEILDKELQNIQNK